MRRKVVCFTRVVAVLVLTTVAFAADPEAQLDATQMATYQRLCQSLVAPCCWRESVAQHRSPESLKSRDEIAAMIVAGKSEREIRNDFVAR
jgi:cytochrome c-type biogenesis protein CcmH/NrfF